MAERLFKNTRFTFVGKPIYSNEPLSIKPLKEGSEWNKERLSLGIKAGNSSPFLNMEYIFKTGEDTFKLRDKHTNELFEVKGSETANKEVLDRTNPKIVIDLEDDFDKKKDYLSLIYKKRNHEIINDDEKTDEDLQKIEEYTREIKELADKRYEFAHIKDAMKLLNANLPNLKDKKVRVTGNVKCNYYKGKNNLQYIPQVIELVPDNYEEQLTVIADIFFEKNCIEDDREQKKMFVNGYIGDTIKADDRFVEKLFPTTIVIDYSKVDINDETQKMIFDIIKEAFEVKNKKLIYKNGVELKVISGAEEIEFNEDCLTDKQKQYIKLGIKTLDDFKPKGKIFGDKINELRLISPTMKDEYSDGAVETVIEVKDLGLYLATDDSDIKKEDIKIKDKKEVSEEDKTREIMKGLFG